MNRSDFLRMIEGSGPSDRTGISEVNELILVFPYFQSAYLLLLKGLSNTADVKFENQLKMSAMHVADREVLYYFLKKDSSAEKTNEKVDEKPVAELDRSTESEQTVIETAMNSEEFINEIEKENILENLEVITPDSTFIISGESDDDKDTTIFLIDGETGSVEEKVFYMDPGFSVEEPEELLELETSPLSGDASEGEETSLEMSQSQLIDKFILANPRIEAPGEKAEKPGEDLSKPFVEERGEFVTETLARIYIKQGYYSKAMDIYEKLSLKFPEKSSYFASQIEKVKELLK